MAPTTRLRRQPNRRVDYMRPAQATAGSIRNPIVIPDTVLDAPRKLPPGKATNRKPKASGTVKCSRVTKAAKKTKSSPERKECVVCASEKTSRCFKDPKDVDVCEHFKTTCTVCVGKYVKENIQDRKLDDPGLACPSQCGHVLEFETVKQMVSKAQFEAWDKALAQHHLRNSEAFITCMDPKCGKYFSIEDCKGKGKAKSEIECPYCEFLFCLKCSRPWHRSSCDKAKDAENKQSEVEIKRMGAKSCPKCGIKIEKLGGCNHIHCRRCNHHFCWECLVDMSKPGQHGPRCAWGNQPVAQDARNYVDGPINPGQIPQLMRQAQRAPPTPHPNFQVPPPQGLAPPAGLPQAFDAFGAALVNFFNLGNGNNNGN